MAVAVAQKAVAVAEDLAAVQTVAEAMAEAATVVAAQLAAVAAAVGLAASEDEVEVLEVLVASEARVAKEEATLDTPILSRPRILRTACTARIVSCPCEGMSMTLRLGWCRREVRRKRACSTPAR